MLAKRLNEAFRSKSSPPLEVQATSQGDGYIKIASFFRVYFGFTAPLIIILCVTSLLPDINPCRAACPLFLAAPAQRYMESVTHMAPFCVLG